VIVACRATGVKQGELDRIAALLSRWMIARFDGILKTSCFVLLN